MNMRGSTRCDAVAALINTKIIAVHLLATSSHEQFFLAKKDTVIHKFITACVFFCWIFLFIYVFLGKKIIR